MTLDVATGNVAEGTPKAYDASMEGSLPIIRLYTWYIILSLTIRT